MKYYELDEEEALELEAIENGTLVPMDTKTMNELKEAAKYTMNKVKNINLRLTQKDLYKLKAMAIHEGIPYQTLAASILHKATT